MKTLVLTSLNSEDDMIPSLRQDETALKSTFSVESINRHVINKHPLLNTHKQAKLK